MADSVSWQQLYKKFVDGSRTYPQLCALWRQQEQQWTLHFCRVDCPHEPASSEAEQLFKETARLAVHARGLSTEVAPAFHVWLDLLRESKRGFRHVKKVIRFHSVFGSDDPPNFANLPLTKDGSIANIFQESADYCLDVDAIEGDSDTFDKLLNDLPAEFKETFRRDMVEKKVEVRKLDQRYLAIAAEVEDAELLAVLLEHTLAKFDLLAYNLMISTSYNPSPGAIEPNPVFGGALKQIIKSCVAYVEPTLAKLSHPQSSAVRSELKLKLLAKEQGCLALAELRQATGNYPDFEGFCKEIKQSPMKSRAAWWNGPTTAHTEALQGQVSSKMSFDPGQPALSKATNSPGEIGENGMAGPEIAQSRRRAVEAYLAEVFDKKGKRITKTDIWKFARYKTRTEFERWERNDSKVNKTANERFSKILAEKPHLK